MDAATVAAERHLLEIGALYAGYTRRPRLSRRGTAMRQGRPVAL
jgi:hypothetical protein